MFSPSHNHLSIRSQFSFPGRFLTKCSRCAFFIKIKKPKDDLKAHLILDRLIFIYIINKELSIVQKTYVRCDSSFINDVI